MLGADDGGRDDPAGLAAAGEPDPVRADLRPLAQRADGVVCVGGEQVEMALVAGAAGALRLTRAAACQGSGGPPLAGSARHQGSGALAAEFF
jgi:hypothetical protein